MKYNIAAVLLASLLGLSAPASANIVLDFEGLADWGAGWLPEDYASFDWGVQHFSVLSNNHPDYGFQSTLGNSYGSTSGEFAAYNAFGVTRNINFNQQIDFEGAYFTSWVQDDTFNPGSSRSVTLNGYADGGLVGSVYMDLSSTQYDWLQAGFAGIDRLEIVNSADNTWWLMDDFTFNYAAADVNAPATWLLALSVLGFVVARRKTL
ncbi:hypothetical protein ACFSJ3_11230 [Corallincola platygyrae]|uniref:PEP-CTERM sorting domain-containing protein n=1 Tax=Corallincola platygyrae TaxID=1193278 RepID=A0ABW4XLY9_9GAMM